MSDSVIIEFFSHYAYQPYYVYGFIILFMTASSFGLPVPEEMTLISAGLVAYMAQNPAKYPPPYPGAEGVDLTILAIICFLAVWGSDFLVYTIGKLFGPRLVKTRFFKRTIGEDRFKKINKIFNKYSYWACGLFRFTPGIRFPGHISCGLMGVSLWKFLLIDGFAALLSVPTQVLLVANYGEVILEKVREFKLILFVIIGIFFLVWLGKQGLIYFRKRRAL